MTTIKYDWRVFGLDSIQLLYAWILRWEVVVVYLISIDGEFDSIVGRAFEGTKLPTNIIVLY